MAILYVGVCLKKRFHGEIDFKLMEEAFHAHSLCCCSQIYIWKERSNVQDPKTTQKNNAKTG